MNTRTSPCRTVRATAGQSQQRHTRQVIERYAAAWQSGDLVAMAGCYAPGFTLHYSGNHVLAGDHVGAERACQVMAEFGRRTRRRLAAIQAIMAGPGYASILVREFFQHNGKAVELNRVLVYAIDADRLQECWVYDRNQPLVDAIINGSPA